MTDNLQNLIVEAARLRADGATWPVVAQKCQRSPETCRQWPRRYREIWTDPAAKDGVGKSAPARTSNGAHSKRPASAPRTRSPRDNGKHADRTRGGPGGSLEAQAMLRFFAMRHAARNAALAVPGATTLPSPHPDVRPTSPPCANHVSPRRVQPVTVERSSPSPRHRFSKWMGNCNLVMALIVAFAWGWVISSWCQPQPQAPAREDRRDIHFTTQQGGPVTGGAHHSTMKNVENSMNEPMLASTITVAKTGNHRLREMDTEELEEKRFISASNSVNKSTWLAEEGVKSWKGVEEAEMHEKKKKSCRMLLRRRPVTEVVNRQDFEIIGASQMGCNCFSELLAGICRLSSCLSPPQLFLKGLRRTVHGFFSIDAIAALIVRKT